MTRRTRSSLFRSAALVGAIAAGSTAFGGIHEWTPAEGGTTYWDDAANWNIGTEDWTDYRIGNNGAQITFRSAVSADDTDAVLVYNGEHTLVAEDASFGLSKPNAPLNFQAPWWFTGNPVLNITSGTYQFGSINLASDATYGGSATLNLNGGALTAPYVTVGADCTIVLNGGTLSATTVDGAGTLSVAGGTFANGENATVSATLSGSGTLTKTGAGTLAFTGSYAAFTGKIAVAEGAGSVTVGDTTIAAGEELQLGVYTWTGAGTEYEDPDTTAIFYKDTNLWSNVNNWLVNGAVPTALPGDDSTVIFPAGDDVTVVVNGAHTGNMTINRNVKLVAENVSSSTFLYVGKVGGTGTLTLAGASSSRWLRLGIGGDYTIDCDLEIKGHVYVANGSAKTLVVNGAFKGDGTVTCNGNADAGIAFYGDTSAFAGYYEGGLRNNGNRDNTKFRSDARGSALASWKFGGYGNTLASPFESDNVTYQFGALNTYVGTYPRLTLAGRTSTTIEVGAKGDSNVGGTLSNNGNTLRQVGDSTTLNLTLTENYGTVEAEAGTVVIYGTVAPAAAKFAGTGATIKIQRSSTTTTVVTPGVADDPETEENEYVEEVTETTTTTYIPASFVPGFTDALVGCQYEVTQETTDGVTYDVYTVLTGVATDSAGTTYDSVALAIAAIEADETGTLTKAITLAKSTTEAVALPLDYTLALNGNTVGSVTGVAGVAVSYNEETGTWTTVDNSEATWQGGTEGNWFDAANWSTGYVPDAGTAVTFTGNATVFLADNNTYDCGSIYISRDNATVTFAPVGYNESNWPRVKVYGNIGAHGNCVLKLYRCGIDNGTTERVTVRPTLQFYNTDGDSWVTGNFQLQASLEGTGEFRVYGGTLDFASDSGITVNDGSVVDFRNYYPTFEGRSGTLHSTGVNGDGRIIVHALPTSSALVYFQNAFKNAERWSGTCELAGISISSIDAANYGNANSTVCFNGVSGYLRAGEGVEVGNVKTIEIGANGLTLNNQYTSGAVKNYLIKADLTGTGAIKFGTKHQLSGKSKYVFTGDVSGFTGAINYGDLDSYRACVYFADSSITTSDFGSLTVPTDWGQIIVEEGKTVNVAATWYGAGGWIINGTVNVAATGSLTCDSNGAKVGGSGTINYAALPTSAPTWNTTAWTGSVVLPATTISTKTGIPLAGLSSANGTLVINGITRSTTSNSIYLGTGAACTIAGTTQLAGDLHVTDGNSNATYTWNKITGTGDILFTTAGGSASSITHAITRLDGYTGTIDVGGNATLTLGTVAVDAAEVGTPLVKLSSTCVMADTAVAAVAVEAGGTALANASVVKESDGLYIAAASVDVTTTTTDPDTQEETTVTTTTKFSTYEAAAAFADDNSVTEIAVLYGDGAVNGWDYDSGTGKLTKNATAIARVGTTQFNTLAAAFKDATAGDTVVLFGASDEAAALAADGATLEIDTTAAYTGTLSGNGTVVANVAFTPVFGEWTGTFVVNWDTSAATSGTAWVLDNYGIAGSTVVIAQPIAHGYLKAPGNGTTPSIAPAVYLKANVYIDNGYAKGDLETAPVTTFSQLGADEGVTLSFRYLANAKEKDKTYYTITKLKDFAGSFVLNAYNQVTVESVELAATPAFGTKVVSATVADTASLTGKIADGYPLVFETDGLYFDPVAQVGEAYYNTLADAVTVANGATVTLVKSTEEGVVVAAGQTVVIQFGEYSTGDITAATDYILNTSWDDATKTGTYTTTAVAAYLTVGETVTPYTVAFTALTDFIASATGSTLRFVGTNPFADTAVPCTTYDAATLTYTKLAAVAQIGTGPSAIQYPTLAEACAAAEQYGYDTVTLLVALGEQTVPDGWDYNAPAEGEEGFGTLTKEMTVTYNVWFVDTDGSTKLADMQTVESGATATKPAEDPVKEGKVFVAWTLGGTAYDFSTPVTATITLIASWEDAPTGTEAADGSGNTFIVPATVATPAGKALTDAATGTITYAQAYALGLWNGTADGAVAEPEVTIAIVDGKVQVAFAGGTIPDAYTVSCQLQSKTELSGGWTDVEGATGATGVALTDSSTMGEKKFYQVKVTIVDKQ